MLHARRSAAQALIWLTLMVPVFVSIAGLAIDGGVLLMSRRHLQSVADGAARAGATRLDMARLRDSAGSEIQLDQTGAAEAARAYLRDSLGDAGPTWQAPPDVQVDVGLRRVHVFIRASVRTAFLRIAHIDAAPVEASAFADVQYGIRDGGGG
jgi:Putative Flp pilus-assembly TadE/G-like